MFLVYLYPGWENLYCFSRSQLAPANRPQAPVKPPIGPRQPITLVL
jgi:hypothetical protein